MSTRMVKQLYSPLTRTESNEEENDNKDDKERAPAGVNRDPYRGDGHCGLWQVIHVVTTLRPFLLLWLCFR